jgi:F-type H+-transporting ATPase subunit gamma
MSEQLDLLDRRLHTAAELKSVVRNMKAIAAVSIVPYENAVRSLAEYYKTVELGLIACLRDVVDGDAEWQHNTAAEQTNVVVFGSDQGMVGQFNEVLADFVLRELKRIPAPKVVWPVGERIAWRMAGSDISLMPAYSVPDTVAAIMPLTAALLEEIHQHQRGTGAQLIVFHNQPLGGKSYQPLRQRLSPFDREWLQDLGKRKWPAKTIPQVMPVEAETLTAFLREYLFVSLFRACAESLASESASRLTAMQSAERKIGELIDHMQHDFNQARQNSIDEELFDVITGYEALATGHAQLTGLSQSR